MRSYQLELRVEQEKQQFNPHKVQAVACMPQSPSVSDFQHSHCGAYVCIELSKLSLAFSANMHTCHSVLTSASTGVDDAVVQLFSRIR